MDQSNRFTKLELLALLAVAVSFCVFFVTLGYLIGENSSPQGSQPQQSVHQLAHLNPPLCSTDADCEALFEVIDDYRAINPMP